MDNLFQSTSEVKDIDPNDYDNDLTSKFLSGEMTFEEYSSKWNNDNEEDISEITKISKDVSNFGLASTERGYRRRKGIQLTPSLMGLMGEANLRFARGDKEMAEKMCHEIIKQAPNVAEPYQTLAQIYEDDPDKSLQFSLLAAHMNRLDAPEWIRLASLSRQKNDYKQTMVCYNQAVKAESNNLSLHLMRLEFLDELEKMNISLNAFATRVKCYHNIVTGIPSTDGDNILKYMRLAAAIYHENNDTERLVLVMSAAYKKVNHLFTLEDTNRFLEILLSKKEYQTCIEVFVANLGVEIEAEIQTVQNTNGQIEEHTNYINCTIPNSLPIDLRCKLLICFIQLKAKELVPTLINDFLQYDVDKAGDLYMDIEEALSSVGWFEMALEILEPLVKNPCFDLGAVWLKHAECLFNLKRIEETVPSYKKVLQHAPQHADARSKLFQVLEQLGHIEEALEVLQQDFRYPISAKLLNQQCCILKKYNQILKYLDAGENLLQLTFAKFKHEEELNIVTRVKKNIESIYSFRKLRGEEPLDESDVKFDEDDTFTLTPQQNTDLFNELLLIALKYKQYYRIQRLAYASLVSKKICLSRHQLEFICLQSCILNKDYVRALKFSKELISRIGNNCTWNIFNYISNQLGTGNNKYLLRVYQKSPTDICKINLGNTYLLSGRYILALRHLLDYHKKEKDALSSLTIGVAVLQMAIQRTVDKHHTMILQALSYFLNYQRLRKCDQESNYNLGRFFHMLGIYNLAIEYYEKALACGPIANCEIHGKVDLTKEIAYNLFYLYKPHSPNIARKYMLKYIVI